MVHHPIAGIKASLAMCTNRELEACGREVPDGYISVLDPGLLAPADTGVYELGAFTQNAASDAAGLLWRRHDDDLGE